MIVSFLGSWSSSGSFDAHGGARKIHSIGCGRILSRKSDLLLLQDPFGAE
ncbi:hypothetical protein OROMI_003043 [Orobanche minor]